MIQPRAVCLISVARTGTNHLISLLQGSCPDLIPAAEIFHKKTVFVGDDGVRQALAARLGVADDAATAPEFVEAVRADPSRTIDVLDSLRQQAGVTCFVFKVFPDHLDWPVVRRAILARHDVVPIFIVRRVIDQYISFQKAMASGVWRDTDTTNVKVDLSADHFQKWLNNRRRWYDEHRRFLDLIGQPYETLRYEDDIDAKPGVAVARFRQAAKSLGIPLADLDAPVAGGMERQDRAASPDDKVSNWPAFESELRSRGLLDNAMGHLA